MAGSISRLQCFEHKGHQGVILSKGVLVEGKGLMGDFHQGGDKQLTLMLTEAEEWMGEQKTPGLCFKRFKANILLEGCPQEYLETGSILGVGQDALVEITAQNKQCHEGCALAVKGVPCKLAGLSAFGVVKQEGVISSGDPVVLGFLGGY